MAELIEMGKTLAELVTIAQMEGDLVTKENLIAKAAEMMPGVECTGDDFIWDTLEKRTFYPSETASIALTQRNEGKDIIKTGIAALYPDFPIVLADGNGAYIYQNGRLGKVSRVNQIFAKNPTILLRLHIFGQKRASHWAWMNLVIARLNASGVRTDNNMGPFFVIRDFFFAWRKHTGEVEIIPIKAVIAEPFANKKKEEIGAFVIWAMNQGLPLEQRFTIKNMAGEEVFTEKGAIDKLEVPIDSRYGALGWIAGPTEEIVEAALFAIKEAAKKSFVLFLPSAIESPKVQTLINDLSR